MLYKPDLNSIQDKNKIWQHLRKHIMNEIHCHVIITNDINNIMTNTLDG